MKKLWLIMYSEAKKYYEKYGDLNINQNYITENGKKLGIWIQNKRVAYKNRFIPKEQRKNSLNPLTEEEVKLLESIGMKWIIKKPNRNNTWYDMYNEAKKYYKKNGNLNIQQNYITENGIKLGVWITTQRLAYKNRFIQIGKRPNKFAPLTDEKVKLLESIGIIWSEPEYRFATTPIKEYKKKILEKRFLEFLNDYIKENKSKIEKYEDIIKINEEFKKTLGSIDNHYRKYPKR